MLDRILTTIHDLLRRRKRAHITFEEVGKGAKANNEDALESECDSGPVIVDWQPLPGAAVCSVTREPLRVGETAMRCAACGMLFSVQGWQFLQQRAGGCCCGCGARQRAEPYLVGKASHG